MCNKILSALVMIAVAMTLSAMAIAEEEAEPGAVETPPEKGIGNVRLYAKTGLGYDSNVFQAPGAPYVDYAAGQILGGANPTVIPQRKSGVFIPYEIKVESAKNREQDTRMLASAKADGRYYPATSVSYANEYTIRLRGGPEFVLGRQGKQEDTFYFGALGGKHQQIYTDHDTGLPKATTLSGTGISDRYNYSSVGVEAAYKHKMGAIGYGLKGQYIVNTYEDPVIVAKMDHSYYMLLADTSFHVAEKSKLELDAGYSVRDYANRHSRDAQGVYAVANPLLLYSFNRVDAKLNNRISPDWQLGLELGYIQRVDHNVHYNDYTESNYGARAQYKHDSFKAKLSLHHLSRKYPNAFAFDVLGQASRTFSGNDLKLKLDMEQNKNSTLWAELDYRNRDSTDLRYAYGRKQIMAGMTWSY